MRDYIIAKCDSDGDFVTGCDGFVIFWPTIRGAFTAQNLRDIADELDRRNAEWQTVIDNDPSISTPPADPKASVNDE